MGSPGASVVLAGHLCKHHTIASTSCCDLTWLTAVVSSFSLGPSTHTCSNVTHSSSALHRTLRDCV